MTPLPSPSDRCPAPAAPIARRTWLAVVATAAAASAAFALPASAATSILFIGNSFTYGALSPTVQNYRTNSVTDLAGPALNGIGTPVGGVPALFKQMTVGAGLDYAVSVETYPGSNLDFHYNNRLALIDRPWDRVVMHGQSNLDFQAPGNPAKVSQYTGLLGNVFRAQNPNVDISLTATWSRADLTYQPQCNTANPPSPWCGAPITQMAIDVQAGYMTAMAQNASLVSRVNPVGLAWNFAIASGFADANPYNGITPGTVNLWASDAYHASPYGYYLHALVVFGQVTGLDPRSLGATETAAMELGFTPGQTVAMQSIAAAAISVVPEPPTYLAMALGGLAVVGWARRRMQR